MRISVDNSGFTNRPVWTKERFKEAAAAAAPAGEGTIIETMSLPTAVSQKITEKYTDPKLDLDCIQKVMGMLFSFENEPLNPLAKQDGGGPGRGLGQYETLPTVDNPKASGASRTAHTRAVRFYENNKIEIPDNHWTKALAATDTFDIVEAGLTGVQQYEMAVLDHLEAGRPGGVTKEEDEERSFTKIVKKCGDGTLTNDMVREYHKDYHKKAAHDEKEVTRWVTLFGEDNDPVRPPQQVFAARDIGVTQSGNTYTITLRKIPYKIPTVWGWDKNYEGLENLVGRWVEVLSDSVSYPAAGVGESDSYTIDGKVITITGKYRIYDTTSDHDTIFKVSYAYLDNYDPNFVRHLVL